MRSLTNGSVRMAERVQIQLHMQPGYWHPVSYLVRQLNEPLATITNVCTVMAERHLIDARERGGELQVGRWTHSASDFLTDGASQ